VDRFSFERGLGGGRGGGASTTWGVGEGVFERESLAVDDGASEGEVGDGNGAAEVVGGLVDFDEGGDFWRKEDGFARDGGEGELADGSAVDRVVEPDVVFPVDGLGAAFFDGAVVGAGVPAVGASASEEVAFVAG